MKTLAIGLSGAVLALIAAGCRPQLAEVELGAEEQQWNSYLKQSYSSYRPPQTAAPAMKDKNEELPASKEKKSGEESCQGIFLDDAVIDPDTGVILEEEIIVIPAVPIEKEKESPETGVREPEVKASSEYVIQHGDTLSGIAKKFYRDGNLYERIYEANRDVIKNPNVLKVGTKIRIPAKQ